MAYMSIGALTLLVGRQEGHPVCKKTEWWGASMVICLERGADLHLAQLMPLPLTVCWFSKIQIGFTFLLPAHPSSPGQSAVKRVCVCVCVCLGTFVVGFLATSISVDVMKLMCGRARPTFIDTCRPDWTRCGRDVMSTTDVCQQTDLDLLATAQSATTHCGPLSFYFFLFQ